jgi:hypothetical protein
MHDRALAVSLCASAVVGCTPSFDWRDVRIDGTPLAAQFPCRPVKQARAVTIAGASVTWTLQLCTTAGVTFAVGTADLADPNLLQPALRELADRALENLAAPTVRAEAAALVPGSTPNQAARRLLLEGRRVDGARVTEQLVLFAHGTRIYQVTALGQSPPAAVIDTFVASIRVAT